MTEPRVVAEGLGFTEGPVWTQDGRLLVTSISHSAVYEVGSGEPRVICKTGGGPNGMAEGEDRVLYVAQNGGIFGANESIDEPAEPGIQAIENGEARYIARGLDAPNDCAFGPDGRLYFTDPRGGAHPGNQRPGRVYAMPLDGEPELLAEGPAFTNGLAFDADASHLYVAETFRQRVLVYPFSDGKLGEAEEFCHLDAGFPDGMAFDLEGRLLVAATVAHQVQVFDRDGKCVERLACIDGSMPTNCCFGGAGGRTIFVTGSAGEHVLAFDWPVAGLPLFPFR